VLAGGVVHIRSDRRCERRILRRLIHPCRLIF
jgi:hypothetical protein